MEHLWSPWRLAYVTRAAHGEDESAPGDSGACIFCQPRGPNADLVLYTGQLCYVILNLYPYNNGHLMVVPNRHIRDLASTTAEERAELMALARLSEIALVEGVHAARYQRRHQPRSSGRCRRAQPSAHSSRSTLER